MMPPSAGKTQREFQLRQIMVNWRSKKCKAKGGISNSWHTTIAIILANALEASRIGVLTPEKHVIAEAKRCALRVCFGIRFNESQILRFVAQTIWLSDFYF
jgi:hypothetical protein